MEEETGRVITKVNLNEEPSVTFKVSSSDHDNNIRDLLLLPVLLSCPFPDMKSYIMSVKGYTVIFDQKWIGCLREGTAR